MSTLTDDVIYYECHITIDPAGERHDEFKALCLGWQFRAADLLMRKSLKPSGIDSFCTGRDSNRQYLETRMRSCVDALNEAGFPVRRYKIEAALLDVRTP